MYGASKHMIDLWMLRHCVLDRVVGLKYFNVYGPYEEHKGEMASMVYQMFLQIVREKRVFLFQSNRPTCKDGEQRRDFIYVKDVAKITCRFLLQHVTGIYNVGTGKARSFNEIAKAIFFSYGSSCLYHVYSYARRC